MQTTTTAYEIAMLAASAGRTDQQGIEDALRIHIRAQRALAYAATIEEDHEAVDVFLNGASLDSIKRAISNKCIPFDVATTPGGAGENPNYIGSVRSVLKYYSTLNDSATGKPMTEAAINRMMDLHRVDGFSPFKIKQLLEVRNRIKAETGRKNRVNAVKKRKKRKVVK